MEIWKEIEGFEGYQVSNLGRVKSFKKSTKGVILKQSNTIPYLQVTLCSSSERKNLTVHRLVCKAFNNNPCPSKQTYVNHIDGNPLNNAAINLEWCTPKENHEHAQQVLKVGLKNNRKLSDADVLTIRWMCNNGSKFSHIAREFGVSHKCVTNIVKRKTFKELV